MRRGLCRLRIVDGRGVSVHWCGVWKGVSTTLRRPYSLCNVDGRAGSAHGLCVYNIRKTARRRRYKRLSAAGKGVGVRKHVYLRWKLTNRLRRLSVKTRYTQK